MFNFPAVYRFISTSNETIYIGSAKVLARRMSAHKNNGHLPKECYQSISRIEYVKCPTHGDALKLEADLIDYYRPHYNKMLKRKDIDVQLDPIIEKINWKLYKELKPLESDKIEANRKEDFKALVVAAALFIGVILLLVT